ncbi:MAG: hypothetical protein P1U88_22760, partial [Thalassobaculaceae bacterium]|nr:hypothetical protein [Thalassobaculaceae bacterium]
MTRKFIGWIPNVSGNLSFSAFGNTSYPSRPMFANAADKNTRYMIAWQKRNTADYIFNNLIVYSILSFWQDEISKWDFLLVANTAPRKGDKQAALEGSVYIFIDCS